MTQLVADADAGSPAPSPTSVERITVSDGTFDIAVWQPESRRGPGLILVPEIFGRSSYIVKRAAALAAAGYVVAVPDLFWRLGPGWAARHDEPGVTASLAMGEQYDSDDGVADCVAALDHLAGLPATGGRVGILGFCLGGTIAYLTGAEADPAVVVSYYGSGVPGALDRLDDVRCPLLLYFGGSDPYINRQDVAAVEAAVAGRPDVEIVVAETAGHAYDNFDAPMFDDPDARAMSWPRTEAFLTEHLPV